jgi:hypothetical protein
LENYFDLSDYVLAADAMQVIPRDTKNLENYFDTMTFGSSANVSATEPAAAEEAVETPSPKKRKARRSR